MSTRFTNKIVVITGGSSGIGLAIAKGLILENAKRVYITGRSQKSLELAVAILGDKAIPIISDVSNVTDLQKLKNKIAEKGDLIDMLFANAGIAKSNIMGQTREEDFEEIFAINTKGIFFTLQTLLPLLRDHASVVLTASFVANKGMENLSIYSASKAAVRSFARSWANDLKDRKIRVNTLSPGFTRTPIQENSLNMTEEQIAAFSDYVNNVVPLGYMAQPEDIAAAALFLAADDSRYINGIELVVDGAFTQI